MNKRNVLRGVLLVLGIILFAWSLLPYIIYRILGLGNLTGIAAGLLMIMAAVLYNWIGSKLAIAFKSRHGRAIKNVLAVCLACIAGIAVLVIVISGLMIYSACARPESNATVVVLGCGVQGERPSLMLEERLEAAAKYLKDNTEAVAILSGGQGSGEDITEAECMRRYLTDKGINEDRLYIEDRSASTRQNIQFSKEIIKQNNLSENIAIVTNEFHEYRAAMVARNEGVRPSAIPARTTPTLFLTFYTRELYGVVFEWIM